MKMLVVSFRNVSAHAAGKVQNITLLIINSQITDSIWIPSGDVAPAFVNHPQYMKEIGLRHIPTVLSPD